jgi:hypothetical protein
MISFKSKPYLAIHLIHTPAKNLQWCIVLDGEVIHHIQNFTHFTKHFGYPDLQDKSIESKGNIQEIVEFVNNDGHLLDTCTQNKIATYLYDNCEKFKEDYSLYYSSAVEECKTNSMKVNSKCNFCLVLKNADQRKNIKQPITSIIEDI